MDDNQKIEKLIFIYNADSGISNALIDSVHKIISPSTYDCKLCEITFGVFGEKAEWKEFRGTFGLEMVFLHRDELKQEGITETADTYTYPIVLAKKGEQLEALITTTELNSMKDMSSLIKLVKDRVSDS